MGILMGTTHLLWLINADLAKCKIIHVPVRYHLVDVLAVYIPVCICLITCYGRILAIWWRQRRRVANASPAAGAPSQTTTVATATHINEPTTSGNNTVDPSDKPMTAAGASSETAVTSGAASASELTHEQQRQKIKSRRTCSLCVAAG